MMKKLTTALVLLASVFVLGGCTSSIHMVNTAGFDQQIPANAEYNYIEAEAAQNVIMGFAFDTNYVDEARESLIKQCDGDLVAVSTQYSTDHNFMHWTNKILMKGICI
jgi:hypothetical protein